MRNETASSKVSTAEKRRDPYQNIKGVIGPGGPRGATRPDCPHTGVGHTPGTPH